MGWFRVENHLVEMVGEVGPLAWAVYMILLRHSSEDGMAYPSQQRMASNLGVTTRTIHKALVTLKTAGWISVHREGGSTNRYTLVPLLQPEASFRYNRKPRSGRTGTYVPLKKTQEEDPFKEGKALPNGWTYTPELGAAIERWLAYKEERRQKYRDPLRQIPLLLSRFDDAAEFVAAVDFSIAQNYSGCVTPITKREKDHARRKTTSGRRRAKSTCR